MTYVSLCSKFYANKVNSKTIKGILELVDRSKTRWFRVLDASNEYQTLRTF